MRGERFGELDAVVCGGSDGNGGGDGPCVVVLHGFGAPGDDLVPLARALDVPREVRFVFPAAPLSLGWGGGRAWWMIDFDRREQLIRAGRRDELTAYVPPELADSRAKVSGLLDDVERRLGVGGDRLVLGGFSQGAMLSLDVALRSDRRLAGLVLMSGTIIAEADWLPRIAGRRRLPVLQSHGQRDELLPYATAERLRDLLAEGGLDVRFVSFRGGHEIPPPVLEGVSAFLREVTRGPAPSA
jgi:phospholipase/carboxylesterase